MTRSLKELQKSLYDAIFHYQKSNFIKSQDYISSRLNIYKYTIFENIRQHLQRTFPGVWSLLGSLCADNAVRLLLKSRFYMPKSGCINWFGGRFPDFLYNIPTLSSTIPYIKDYALYEWLLHVAHYLKQTRSAISMRDLTCQLNTDAYFKLIPSFLMFKSAFPIDEIHDIAIHKLNKSIFLNFKCSTQCIIVAHNQSIKTFWIQKDLWTFIHCLFKNKDIATSILYAKKINAQFDLPYALYFLVKHKLIKDIV
ncbi:MAG: DNA-binding domain-containing protein [Proteobacteria bacterium]|nr:DNA-binding domain-containing protein [Pseudomonadota bacterium]